MPGFPSPRQRRRVLLAALLAPLLPAMAQDWPSRPITVVVPFPAGGGTDVAVRALQPALQAALGQPLVIDNRGGAGGTIGTGAVAKAAPDGYTVGVATTSTHAVSPSVYKRLPYDPLKDFAYAGFIGTSPYVLVAHPSLDARDLKSFLAAANARPEGTSFASVGAGTVSHLLGEKFKTALRVAPVHVPYRGAAPAYTDLIGGQVQFLFDNPVGLAAYIRGGKLNAIASTAPNALLAGVPTFAEAGMAGFDQSLWYGFAFPKGTPAAIVTRFNLVLNKVLTDRALAADLAAKGINAAPGTPQAMQQAVARDTPFWGAIARDAGVAPQ
ncbi:tripartite tricarboxylate transporter substrate-binding protein [Pseudorhodoferax sp. LjRoot39]|uniref:Bug family tripartite tricarboxylate transporter substrate binding protein n=1 Tax=Pseudorhodoferax sp. LjRoot39 TaxID=3342328 RepID=UPI003ECF84DA